MLSLTGTAKSIDEFRSSMLTFATRTMGNFSDFFSGSLGTSLWNQNNREVLGLKHKGTGAVYLFDFAPSYPLYNGTEDETTIVGQLLDNFVSEVQTDYNSIRDPDGNIGQVIEGPFSAANFLTITLSSGVYTLIDNYAQSQSTQDGLFRGLVPGQGLLVEDQLDSNLFHIIQINEVRSDGEIALGSQVGALDAGVVSSDLLTAHLTNQSAISKILFSVQTEVPANQTPFGDMRTSMWSSEVTAAQSSRGFFPKSSRLDFNVGVDFWFYGNNDIGDEYFHMVLRTKGATKFSHWWMGRVTGQAPAISNNDSACGMFLGTSGPFTDSANVDHYQNPFEFGDAVDASINPCIMVTPFGHNNGEAQSISPATYTGAAQYSHNFGLGNQGGWTASGVDTTLVTGALQFESTGPDPYVELNGVSINPGLASTVRFAIKRTEVGDAGPTGQVFFKTSTSDTYTGHSVSWDATNLHADLDGWWVIDVDMSPHPDWEDTITAIRIDTPNGTSGGDVYQLSWIRVDDGDFSVTTAPLIEQPFGGVETYGPLGAGHSPLYSPSLGFVKQLESTRYSIQSGLNGFNGPLTYGMQNNRDRTFHLRRPNGLGNPSPNIPNVNNPNISRFNSAFAVLYECPVDNIRDVRLTPVGGDSEVQARTRYMHEKSFYIYLGEIPGVFRGTLIQGVTPRSTAFGDVTLDQFPASEFNFSATHKYPEDINTDSGMASFFYKRD